jgi:hypothetical protein
VDSLGLVLGGFDVLTWATRYARTRGGQNAVFTQRGMEYPQAGGHSDGLGGAHCKTVGLAYVGSNPTPATNKPAGQAWSIAILPVGSGSGLRHRCGCLEDREDSASGQVGAVVRLVQGERCIAAVLLGVVELWLSQARPSLASREGISYCRNTFTCDHVPYVIGERREFSSPKENSCQP